ncbi:MAG: hypothetical protein FJ137_20630 [Deltaproteobacteria bacterium]|nr:hypothetical protein [Deltaproteobacteria bacterium]
MADDSADFVAEDDGGLTFDVEAEVALAAAPAAEATAPATPEATAPVSADPPTMTAATPEPAQAAAPSTTTSKLSARLGLLAETLEGECRFEEATLLYEAQNLLHSLEH